jgi:hypothetical protein
MVVMSVGLGAHADAAVAAALGAAVLAESKARPALTTLLLTLGALVQAHAALFLLAWVLCLARRKGVSRAVIHGAGAGLLAAAAYAPFWEGARTFSGLAAAEQRTSASLAGAMIRLLNGNAVAAFGSGTGPTGVTVRAVGALAIVAAVVTVARSGRTGGEPWRAAALLFAVYVLVTPWFLPWHLLGLVALAAIVADDAITRGVLTFSGSSLAVLAGGRAAGLAAQTVARYGPPLVAAWTGWDRRGGLVKRHPGPGTQ